MHSENNMEIKIIKENKAHVIKSIDVLRYINLVRRLDMNEMDC